MNKPNNFLPEFAEKMRKAGVHEAAIRIFRTNYAHLLAGETGLIPESAIEPVAGLPRFDEVTDRGEDKSLLAETVVVKLNGGLGTSMGLDRAKSLLPIKNDLTFLDFIARQILYLRRRNETSLRFLLMNSFNTSAETREFLQNYPELGAPGSLELMQSLAPKVDAQTLRPVSWPANPDLEWYPPGHGDLYPSLLGSGWLDRLLADGVKYLFVSNADNLGASLDLRLLTYFAQSNKPFLMEVCQRTAADRKGGHLARRDGKLLLRESAQCPREDSEAFQDISRHHFFNTNNLWVRLDHLKQLLAANEGRISLAMIKNSKTVDPRDETSPRVFQLETAMGSAIECFQGAGAVVVPRTRFAPVKTTADLLALRSDAYEITGDSRLTLAAEREGIPPAIVLDPDHYRFVDQLDAATAKGVPSLVGCRELLVRGPVEFDSGVSLCGKVSMLNPQPVRRVVPAGVYEDVTVNLDKAEG